MIGDARSPWAAAASVLGLGATTVTWALVGPAIAVPVLACSLVLLELSSVHVRASATGGTTSDGPLAWPVTQIPLRRIVHAEALEVSPRSWGYRGSLLLFDAAVVIVQRRPALQLVLEANKTFLVTVDDTATGVALINDEIERDESP